MILCLFSQGYLYAQQAEQAHERTLNAFIRAYNNRDYASMRETMGGPLKLILTEKRLEQMYGGMYDQLGKARISGAIWKPSSVKVNLLYERDTTEFVESGYSFSKQSKIIGLGNSSPKYRYEKKPWDKMDASDFSRIDSLLTRKHEAAAFSGCVMVIENGQIVYEGCRGRAIYPDGPALTPSTPFEIASCSKAFTAALIAILEQQGKLQYDDDITKYFPELKKYKGATVEHLIHHTGGIPDYMELFEQHWDKSRIAGNADVISLLAKHQPKKYFKAGEKFEYSNTGYVLLAAIAEKITGKTFADLMKEELFNKIGMESAFLYNYRRNDSEWKEGLAYGYILDFRTGKHQLPDSIPSYDYVRYLDGITGDGMVNTNVRDMLLWDQTLRNPGLLSEKSIERIFTSGKIKNGELTHYGFGWDVQAKEGYERFAEHSGSWPGYTSYVLRFLDQQRAVVIFSNNEYLFLMKMAHQIAQISR